MVGQGPLTKSAVKRRILQAVKAGTLRYTQHALDRMAARGITVMDLKTALINGFHDQEKDVLSAAGVWRYRIEEKSIDGMVVRAVIELEDEEVVVTVFK